MNEDNAVTEHNHMTRDIKPYGECPGCDEVSKLTQEIEDLKAETQ